VNKKNILIFIASENFSGEEFSVVNEKLIRNGCGVFIASDAVYCCHADNGLNVKNDISLFNIHEKNFSALIIIGGEGIKKYFKNKLLHKVIYKFHCAGKIIGAICLAPATLAYAGILRNKFSTCFFDAKDELLRNGAVWTNTGVVKTQNVITAAGPKYSAEFILTVINELERT